MSTTALILSSSLLLAKSRSDRAVEFSALLQIERAVDQYLDVFFLSTDDLMPEDRFELAATLLAFPPMNYICDVDVHEEVRSSNPVYEFALPSITWSEYLANESRLVRRRLGEIGATYGSQLGFDVIIALSKTASHPWLDLMEFSDLRAQRHRRSGHFPEDTSLCTDNDKIRAQYARMQKSFLAVVHSLEEHLSARHIMISDALGVDSCPPIHLKRYGGILSAECIE